MARASSHPLPPTPPAPVYSPAPVRSQSPRVPDYDQFAEPPKSYFPASSSTLAPSETSPNAPRNNKLNYSNPRVPSSVRIHPPDAISFVVDDNNNEDTSHLSPILSAFPRRPNESPVAQDSSRRRVVSDHPMSRQSPTDTPSPTRSLDGISYPESHEPLQYHHQIMEEVEKRASKMNLGTNRAGGLKDGDPAQIAHHNLRQSYLGSNLQRPDSGFSSQSDSRGRTLSPHPSSGHLRSLSHNSRSPDARPLSYVDLLNVPYPQPAPSGAENLINQGLRTVVGENASLLSTRKTLDMYRANVKKTNDPEIQYQFAIFMISAAREEGLEEGRLESSVSSQKSDKPIKNDLLKEAKNILQRLCDKSYPFAQYYLADGYASGLFSNGKPDLDRSFPLFLAASKHGHAEAMYRTALCYEYGWGCRVDAAKAVQFYQHAASKNHPGAMLRLGRACLTGEMGLTKRYREGIRWLKRGSESADYQYNQAPFDLACLHEDGYGPDVFKDESYAAQLYTKAADLGHKDAGFRLGEAYEFGQLSCPKDPALSVHFYTLAAEQGHVLAQMALCAWYMVGVQGVLERDEGEAYEWARRAAEQGLPKAQYTLGYFTEMGIGCRRDPLEANVWYVRAADQGEERAKHRISAIRAAAGGADPVTAAAKKNKVNGAAQPRAVSTEGDKKKRFGLF